MSSPLPDERLWELEERYRGNFETEPLSYGTVRDFADSRANLGGLARANGDMKDVQRCWALKAVLGAVERGAAVVEIGAGEPLVADLLVRLGHRVTVVDPYDGTGNGPREYDAYRRAHPKVDFVRERFPPRTALPSAVACVYSVSVLEHVPLEELGHLIGAARELVGPHGRSIHAVDHVVAGWGADSHLERLERIVDRSGLSTDELQRLLDRLRDDPDTYFVSAEAHERWRGDLPYEQHQMRRIASIGLVGRGT